MRCRAAPGSYDTAYLLMRVPMFVLMRVLYSVRMHVHVTILIAK
jgi:hypothetical protein